MIIIKPVHVPLVSGVERQEIVREFLPFDLSQRIQLRLEVGLLPGTDVKGMVKLLGAKDNPVGYIYSSEPAVFRIKPCQIIHLCYPAGFMDAKLNLEDGYARANAF